MTPDDQLLRDLEGLRADVTFPPTPDVASRIADFLPPRAGTAPLRRRSPLATISRPLVVFATISLLLVLAVVATLAIPPARESVARWLHIDLPGIRIERVQHDDGPEHHVPTSLGGSLLLGTPVSLDEANALLASPLQAPSMALVGAPMEIWQRNGGETISLLYSPSGMLPEIGETGVGMLLMRVQPGSDDTMLYVKKSFGVESPVSVAVGGREGWWIVNGQLTVFSDEPNATATRPSGHVLIWWDGNGAAWRMESALPQADAIRIAESLEPLSGAHGNHEPLAAVWANDRAMVAPAVALYTFIIQEVPHAPIFSARPGRRDAPHRSRSRECWWLGLCGTGDARRRRGRRDAG